MGKYWGFIYDLVQQHEVVSFRNYSLFRAFGYLRK